MAKVLGVASAMAGAPAAASAVAPPVAASVETITQFAGQREQNPSLLSHIRPDFAFYDNSWNAYLENRGNVDS